MRSIWRRDSLSCFIMLFIHKSSALGVGLVIFWKGLAAVWFQDALHQHLPVGAMDETQYSYFLWGLEDWALSRTRLGHPYLLETSEPFQLHESAWESLKNPNSIVVRPAITQSWNWNIQNYGKSPFLMGKLWTDPPFLMGKLWKDPLLVGSTRSS